MSEGKALIGSPIASGCGMLADNMFEKDSFSFVDDPPKWIGNSARLTGENSLEGLHPVAYLKENEEGDSLYKILRGWKFLGWTSAPYQGCQPDALVYETEDGDLWWGHGSRRMIILNSI